MFPKLSIITISYICAIDRENTILSVVEQTFSDIEYIIVDGGSTDGSFDVIKKYEKSLSKWISEPDSGIYDAMNKGIKAAKGNYILFLNAGDTFYETSTLGNIPFAAFCFRFSTIN